MYYPRKTSSGLRHLRKSRSPGCARHNGRLTLAARPGSGRISPERTMTVSPLSSGSRIIRCSTPRGRINTPRSAPACSIRCAHQCVDQFLSRTISPETACETLITVARSSMYRIGAPIALSALSPSGADITLIELPHPYHRPPTEVAVPGILQICMGDLLKTRDLPA